MLALRLGHCPKTTSPAASIKTIARTHGRTYSAMYPVNPAATQKPLTPTLRIILENLRPKKTDIFYNNLLNDKFKYHDDQINPDKLYLIASEKRSYSLLHLAAERGSLPAINAMAVLILKERIEGSDGDLIRPILGVTLLEKIAEIDNLEAINNLAYCYLTGRVVLQNISKALHLYKHAWRLGDPTAQNKISLVNSHLNFDSMKFKSLFYESEFPSFYQSEFPSNNRKHHTAKE